MSARIPPEAVSVATFDVSGQRAGWCVVINGEQMPLHPYVAVVDYTRHDSKIRDSVAHTRCSIVAAALETNAVLRHAYATLAALGELLSAIDACSKPGAMVDDVAPGVFRRIRQAKDLVAAIKEG